MTFNIRGGVLVVLIILIAMVLITPQHHSHLSSLVAWILVGISTMVVITMWRRILKEG